MKRYGPCTIKYKDEKGEEYTMVMHPAEYDRGEYYLASEVEAELAKRDEEIARLRKTLEGCLDRQIKVQDLMRKYGYKIDDLKDPVQKLYFAIYTELCEVDAIARRALERKE